MTGQRVIKFKTILTTFDPKIIKHLNILKRNQLKSSQPTQIFVGADITLNLPPFPFNPTLKLTRKVGQRKFETQKSYLKVFIF